MFYKHAPNDGTGEAEVFTPALSAPVVEESLQRNLETRVDVDDEGETDTRERQRLPHSWSRNRWSGLVAVTRFGDRQVHFAGDRGVRHAFNVPDVDSTFEAEDTFLLTGISTVEGTILSHTRV